MHLNYMFVISCSVQRSGKHRTRKKKLLNRRCMVNAQYVSNKCLQLRQSACKILPLNTQVVASEAGKKLSETVDKLKKTWSKSK